MHGPNPCCDLGSRSTSVLEEELAERKTRLFRPRLMLSARSYPMRTNTPTSPSWGGRWPRPTGFSSGPSAGPLPFL